MINRIENMGSHLLSDCQNTEEGSASECLTPHKVDNKTVWMFRSFGLCIQYIF